MAAGVVSVRRDWDSHVGYTRVQMAPMDPPDGMADSGASLKTYLRMDKNDI